MYPNNYINSAVSNAPSQTKGQSNLKHVFVLCQPPKDAFKLENRVVSLVAVMAVQLRISKRRRER